MRLPLAAGAAAALLVVGVAGAGAQDAAGKKQIEGTWELVGVVRGGKERPADKEKTTVTFAAGTMTMRGATKGGSPKEKAVRYTLDVTKTPHWIDIDAEAAGRKEKVLGLYEVKGDTLRLTLGRPDADRPASLESKEGDKTTVAQFKRVK